MKTAFYILFLLCVSCTQALAQHDKQTEQARNNEKLEEVPQNPFQQDTVKGNAAKSVIFVYGTESCASGMRGIAINNTSERIVAAKVEVTTTYSGHTSKKILTIDDLSPHEKRTIGCTGCSDKSLYTTCSTYRAVIAVYKYVEKTNAN